MATTSTNNVKVGDVMIYRARYGADPVRVNVSKVTKAGWVRFTKPDGTESELYKGDYRGLYEPPGKNGRYNRSISDLRVDTPEAWAKLTEEAAKATASRAEKEADDAERDRAYKARVEAELAEVKLAVGDLDSRVKYRSNLPDGTRLLLVEAPVKEDYRDRKGTVEVVLIKLKDKEDWDFNRDEAGYTKKVKVEMAYTYANGNNSSFSSCSTTRHDTDLEGVWEALRSVYHSW